MVSVGRHKNIQLLAYSEIEAVSGFVGNFKIKVRKKARFIDEELCTGCGDCAQACPIEVDNPFDLNLGTRKAAYRTSAQAVPGTFTIEKRGMAPCREACPTDQRAQGYIALVRRQRYADAYWAIRREHPFPSVCGRVCNHACEEACSRGQYDQPVNIMGIKRFVADWAFEHRRELPGTRDKSLMGTPFERRPQTTGKRIAVIGAGPAGLTAALDLVRLGHQVSVFEALSVAGGMMRVGIPPHRLPIELLDWEIQQILDEGVDLHLDKRIDDVPGLLEIGYDAVLIATGAHQAKKLSVRHSNHPDNWLSLDFLRRTALGEPIDLSGKKILVLGGGNVALDTARTAIRLGKPEVRMACLESRGEMPGFAWEVKVAEEEGIQILPGRSFKEIMVDEDHLIGVRCVKVNFHGFKHNRPDLEEISHSDHILPADVVIWAIGQGPDFSYLPPDGSIHTRYPIGVLTDPEMMTSIPGIFCAGDLQRGMTFFVVDAIGAGHHVARCIDRYVRGEKGLPEPEKPHVANLEYQEIKERIESGEVSRLARTAIQTIGLDERAGSFREVDLTLSEDAVLAETERCMRCGICAECLECVAACERGAINHEMRDSFEELEAGTIILATGFQDFDPRAAPELGYGSIPDVITAMEFERMINPSGPTGGNILLKNGHPPKSVAILHCIGSRDERYNEYCSRVCCMYSLKIAHLVREYVEADVVEIYRDMRSFGKGYEEFYNRTEELGVNFYHGRVSEVEKQNGKLRVHWDENFFDQPDHVDVDMVILATGFEPRPDTRKVAHQFGLSRSPNGFFRERHPKLGPVETASEGIFLAGTCQSPMDIPDSVAQAGCAAAAALSLIDQGTITLDPSITEVAASICSGCGQCMQSCPYNAITLTNMKAEINAYLCKGCGTCAAACPNKATTLINYTDRQLIAEMDGMLA
jgi:heterodisulfide reductase subunit A2